MEMIIEYNGLWNVEWRLDHHIVYKEWRHGLRLYLAFFLQKPALINATHAVHFKTAQLSRIKECRADIWI